MNRRNLFAALFAAPIFLVPQEKKRRIATITDFNFDEGGGLTVYINKDTNVHIANCIFTNCKETSIDIRKPNG